MCNTVVRDQIKLSLLSHNGSQKRAQHGYFVFGLGEEGGGELANLKPLKIDVNSSLLLFAFKGISHFLKLIFHF